MSLKYEPASVPQEGGRLMIYAEDWDEFRRTAEPL